MRLADGMMGAMARNRDAYNTTDSPVVIDALGHTIGGREHDKVDAGDEHVIAAVERGALLLREDRVSPEAPVNVLDVAELDAAEQADENVTSAPTPRPSRAKSKE